MIENIRKPAVAGQFYPADASDLKSKILEYLDKVSKQEIEGEIKAILVPHAGYDFSAPVSAYAYKQLEGKKIENVIIICNSHSSFFSDIAIDDSDAWETPLGQVEVNRELVKKLADSNSEIVLNSIAHESDHTLEVQLPFLQVALKPGFKIVPILFGNTKDDSYENLAEALKNNLGENDLVVISTDMSHYPNYEDANLIDKKTLEIINTGSVEDLEKNIREIEQKNISNEEILLCGVDGAKTVMKLKGDLEWQSEVLGYKNSGDSLYGDKESVVGYGAVVFVLQNVGHLSAGSSRQPASRLPQDDKQLNQDQKNILLNIAKDTVESFVKTGKIPDFSTTDERLNWKEGVFVTLHENGNLRGCIGQIIPSKDPLWQVVRDMAIEAATDDPRFSPVSESELGNLDYEISVLSAPEKIDDWKKIELGKHGVIVKKGYNSGVFLPQVADETGWNLEKFLSELCFQKAGLPSDCYKNNKDVELYIFSAQVFGD